MAQPSSRTELKDYCLRKLGFPVVDINVDDDQLEDRIDDSLQYFQQFHFGGTERIWLAHQLTAGDIANKYITLCDNIIGVSKVFPYTGASQSSTSSAGFNIFDINYQLRLNDFYNLTSSSYTYYVIAREHLSMLDMIITGEYPYTFNKNTHKLALQIEMAKRFNPGNYMVFECIRIVDSDIYSAVFNEIWVKEYTAQLFKRQWGENLKKYGNYVLPGGLVIQGDKIWLEAQTEIEKLEDKLRDTYEEPIPFLVG
jgi:hypothetical protein